MLYRTGQKAFSEWSSTNYDAMEIFDMQDRVASFTLEANEYLPVTMLWLNKGRTGALNVSIEDPAGMTTYDTTG